MNSSRYPCSDDLKDKAEALGFSRIGIAHCDAVEEPELAHFQSWLKDGNNAAMDYLERNTDVRRDPSLLLEDARSIIVCAASYYHPDQFDESAPSIAAYAQGYDYHTVLRDRLELLAKHIRETYGGNTRVCIDTVPMRERYWAMRAGVGFRGFNGCLIVPGVGSYCFIGSILSTVEFRPDRSLDNLSCDACGRCATECPAQAIVECGKIDSRRCLSYLTIEHRGAFPEGTDLHGRLYGCDICQRVCPHNAHPMPTAIAEFGWREDIRRLTLEEAAQMTQEQFSRTFRDSAIKRTKVEGLRRNARSILDAEAGE